jgi:hypothetical protein
MNYTLRGTMRCGAENLLEKNMLRLPAGTQLSVAISYHYFFAAGALPGVLATYFL